jgi:hypothetical protein
LRHTLPGNLEHNPDPEVEFVLLDYDSSDGLEEWVRSEMTMHLGRKLNYYQVRGLPYFFHAHAKNLAHLLARGEFLCNLDCDNFAIPEGTEFLRQAFARGPHTFIRSFRSPSGRLAMPREAFIRFGGYDEDMHCGWGWEDNNLSDRIKWSGELTFLDFPEEWDLRLEHSDEERERECQLTRSESAQIHEQLSRAQHARRQLVVNQGRWWGYWPEILQNCGVLIPGEQVAIYDGKSHREHLLSSSSPVPAPQLPLHPWSTVLPKGAWQRLQD